ncbi:hypothetical protein F2P81_019018 [Scophthalmus maximus]|uniref:Uncharacterized protein n=1 Tax=Scophthalmus maximus TaxID=52904 RepID=A0A6A4S675_SCOMX|nr:hypothetical protein F2P81_019018 [Scophthalmus maximus]
MFSRAKQTSNLNFWMFPFLPYINHIKQHCHPNRVMFNLLSFHLQWNTVELYTDGSRRQVLDVTQMSWEMTVVPLSHRDGWNTNSVSVRKSLARGFSVRTSKRYRADRNSPALMLSEDV